MPEEARTLRDTLSLYRMAEEKHIDVDLLPLRRAHAMSMNYGRRYAIAMDPAKFASAADEKVKLCHELGHCVTGSFYNRYAARDVRARYEHHADRWAIGQLVPRKELEAALADGIIEVWDLAEHFDVTEPFMKKALKHYGLAEDF